MGLLMLLLWNVHCNRITRRHSDQGYSQKRTSSGIISSAFVPLTMAVFLLLAKNNLAFSNKVMLGRNSFDYSLQHRIERTTIHCRRHWQAAGTGTALFSNTATSAFSNTTNIVSIDDCLAQWNHHQQQQIESSANSTTPSTNTIQFVDATWFHKGKRNGRQEFEEGPRLPGAIHWDIGDLATTQEIFPNLNLQGLKNVFPPKYMVGKALEQMLGSSDTTTTAVKPRKTTTLVVYGRKGTLFLPRVWYMLKKYCKDGTTVKILNGSLEEWQDRGGPVEEGPLLEKTNTLIAKELMKETSNDKNGIIDEHYLVSPSAKDRLVDKDFVLRVIENNNNHDETNNNFDTLLPSIIIDTRGSSFAKKGHMPGAIHIPYASFFASNNKDDACSFLDSKTQLKEALKEALKRGITVDEGQRSSIVLESLATKPPLLTCGTGVSVCTVALVLDELGFPEPWIYDGSWDEWGKDPTTPKIV